MGESLRLCSSRGSKHNNLLRCVSLSFALYIAIGSFNVQAAADPADSERIILTEENLNNYAQEEGGKTRLKTSAETSPRHYIIGTPLDLDGLELNNSNTRLTLDMQYNDDSSIPPLFVNNIQVGEGHLDIVAAAPKKKASGQSEQISDSEFSGSAVEFSETSDKTLPILRQTGGVITITAQDNATAMDGANAYQIDGGNLYITSQDNATALYTDYSDIDTGAHNGADILFSQTGGQSIFVAKDKSTIFNSNQSAEISGGLMQINATDNAKAVILRDSDTEFRQQGGTILIKADKESIGLETAKLTISGGKLYLQSGDNGKAVHLVHNPPEYDAEDQTATGGQFLLKSGLVQIAQNSKDPGGYAIYGEADSHAEFAAGSILQPILDADNQGNPITGLMSFGSVHIDPQAKFAIGLANAAALKTDTPLTLDFLESREAPIDGSFIDSTSGEKLFFKYELDKSADGKHYQLKLSPKPKSDDKETGDEKDNTGKEEDGENDKKNDPSEGDKNNPSEGDLPHPHLQVSDILHGNNKRATVALEEALRKADAQTKKTDSYQAINSLYDALYNSDLGGEEQIKSRLRRLTPHQATRLPALTLNAQMRFSEELQGHLFSFYDSEREGLQPIKAKQQSDLPYGHDNDQNHTTWLMPVVSRSHYYAKNSSFDSLNADYSGLNFGVGGHLNEAIISFSGEFDSGHLHDGQSYNADRHHTFIGGGYARCLPVATAFHPVLAATVSYGNSEYKQNRRDSFDQSAKAHIRQNSFLTGIIFSQYYQLADYNLSLVPQIGLDYAYLRQNSWSEKGGRLPLQVKMTDYNSLQSKLGGMIVWNRENGISLNAYGYYHYVALGENVNLQTKLRDAPTVRWQTKGENINPSSANLGAKISYQLLPNIRLSSDYGVFLREKQTEQGFSAKAEITF